MIYGHEAVSKFEREREFEVDGKHEYSLFHQGKMPHPTVVTWIQKLRQEATEAEKLLIDLINQMLYIEPTGRPKAAYIEISTIRVALFSMCGRIAGLFENLCKSDVDEVAVEPWVEKIRFVSLVRSLDLHDPTCVSNGPAISFEQFRSLSCQAGSFMSKSIYIERSKV
jgi:hypothetical protein